MSDEIVSTYFFPSSAENTASLGTAIPLSSSYAINEALPFIPILASSSASSKRIVTRNSASLPDVSVSPSAVFSVYAATLSTVPL